MKTQGRRQSSNVEDITGSGTPWQPASSIKPAANRSTPKSYRPTASDRLIKKADMKSVGSPLVDRNRLEGFRKGSLMNSIKSLGKKPLGK